ncbi:MAG: hypothetical protein AB1898_32515 [Acidobacteriota bacterium]
MTCTTNEWPDCLEQILPGDEECKMVDFRALILGLPSRNSKKRELRLDEICRIVLRFEVSGQWLPSPESSAKDKALDAIRAEVIRQARYFGTPTRLSCNDFNLEDPQVFAIAEVEEYEGKLGRLFLYLDFNGKSAVCATKHVDTRHSPEALVKKVRKFSIKLEPGGKVGPE